MNRPVNCAACNVVNKKIDLSATQFKCSNCGTMNTISPQARAAAQKNARVVLIVVEPSSVQSSSLPSSTVEASQAEAVTTQRWTSVRARSPAISQGALT